MFGFVLLAGGLAAPGYSVEGRTLSIQFQQLGNVTSRDTAEYALLGIDKIEIRAFVGYICDGAFANWTSLTQVQALSPHLVGIGMWAFYGCTALGSAQFQMGNLRIIEGYAFTFAGTKAFGGWPGPQTVQVSLPQSLEFIGEWAFAGTTVAFTGFTECSVKVIGGHAFDGCHSVWTELELPRELEVLGDGALARVQDAQGLVFPASLRELGMGVCEASGFGNIRFLGESALTVVPERAFRSCVQLWSVVLPDSVLEISAQAFDGCVQLRELTVSSQLRIIGQGAFRGAGVTHVDLSQRLEEIGEGAFEGCAQLGSINIPEGVKDVPARMCSGCTKLASVMMLGVETVGLRAFQSTAIGALKAPHVVAIGREAFQRCEQLMSMDCPVLENLAEEAFESTGLREVRLADTVETIGDRAFFGCSKLADVSFSDGIKTVGSRIFASCNVLGVDYRGQTANENVTCALLQDFGPSVVIVARNLPAGARLCERVLVETLHPTAPGEENNNSGRGVKSPAAIASFTVLAVGVVATGVAIYTFVFRRDANGARFYPVGARGAPT